MVDLDEQLLAQQRALQALPAERQQRAQQQAVAPRGRHARVRLAALARALLQADAQELLVGRLEGSTDSCDRQ